MIRQRHDSGRRLRLEAQRVIRPLIKQAIGAKERLSALQVHEFRAGILRGCIVDEHVCIPVRLGSLARVQLAIHGAQVHRLFVESVVGRWRYFR